MDLYEIDPLGDERWSELVVRSEASSLFHTREWLEALQRTYGFEPVAFTDSPPGHALRHGLLFCRVNSWMTGRRLVSLPFSDHCEPLVSCPRMLSAMLESLKDHIGHEGRYVELRPLTALPCGAGFQATSRFHFHSVDLTPPLATIFARFHRSHTQRTIRRAERSKLIIDSGRSAAMVAEFYALLAKTRRRHGVPLQPLAWFRNIVASLGDRVTIYVARRDEAPVASIFTARHGQSLVFKYGGSDASYHRYGGTCLLFWHAVQEAKSIGVSTFDLGRSDWDNEGLVAFKDHLGAQRTALTYYRYMGTHPNASADERRVRVLHAAARFIPKRIQTRIGGGLYKHFA